MLRTIHALVKKEFHQVFRDPFMLRLIFMMPMIQLLVLGYAISTDVKNIYTAVYDFDHSEESRDLVRSFSVGNYFRTGTSDIPLNDCDRNFTERGINAVLVIPNDFSEHVRKNSPAQIGLVVDGSNANSASIAIGYANLITSQFNQRRLAADIPIGLRQRILYNPEGESVYFIIPGIVAVLLTMITMLLTAMAIVREREAGTLEQLMVTPIKTPALILGKTIPFAILGYVELSVALAFGVLWFHIPFVGSWALLYGLSFIFLLTTLGVGMFISTIATTQQQAMFFTWFFSIFSILMSGFFIPIENMPPFVQKLTYLNPLRYYMIVVRGIMMKGAGIGALRTEVLVMVGISLALFSASWMRFAKRVK